MGWILQIKTGRKWKTLKPGSFDYSREFKNVGTLDGSQMEPFKIYLSTFTNAAYRKIHTDPLVMAIHEAQEEKA